MKDPAGRRATELVLALRPSIARQCGVVTDGVDVVTEHGLLAWKVAMSQLAADMPGRALHDWATSELVAEQSRWQDGAVVLGLVARWIANSAYDRRTHLHAVVANVAALRERVHAGRATLTDADRCRAEATRRACTHRHASLAHELDLLIDHTPSTPLAWASAGAVIPLVTAVGVRALRAAFASQPLERAIAPKVAS